MGRERSNRSTQEDQGRRAQTTASRSPRVSQPGGVYLTQTGAGAWDPDLGTGPLLAERRPPAGGSEEAQAIAEGRHTL